MIDIYDSIQLDESNTYPLIGCPIINTQALEELGLIRNGKRQTVRGAEILPAEFLNPYDDSTGRLNKTVNTVSIHWYAKSWMSKQKIIRSRMTRPLHRIFGKDFFRRFNDKTVKKK